MPLPIMLAHKLVQPAVRRAPRPELLDFLRPDGKSQVTVEYVNGKPSAHRHRRHFHAAQRQRSPPRRCAADVKKHIIDPVVPADMVDAEHQVPHQPDRPLRHRRTARRHRPDRAQDHRGHLRRHGPARRRRVLRQGSDEGGPLGLLHGALHRQEHRGRRPGRAAAKCSWPTPSAWPSRSPCWSTPSAPARSPTSQFDGAGPRSTSR